VLLRIAAFLTFCLLSLPAAGQTAGSSGQASEDAVSSSPPVDTARAAHEKPAKEEAKQALPAEAHPPVEAAGLDVWGGWSMATGHVIGQTPESSFTAGGVRYRHPLTALMGDRATLAYTGGVVLADLHIPSTSRPLPPDSMVYEEDLDARGLGATPVGLELAAAPQSRVRPFISGSTGFIYFFEPVPDAQGKHFNFTVSAGAGLRVRVSEASRLSVGYRYHHTSNGSRGKVNPGVDAHILYAGVTLFPRLFQ
jgi:opacity protein-like surface antigen